MTDILLALGDVQEEELGGFQDGVGGWTPVIRESRRLGANLLRFQKKSKWMPQVQAT